MIKVPAAGTMCDVTKENFEEKLPEILASIDRSNFVAFDAEFTGLYSSESPKNRSVQVESTKSAN